MDTQEIWSSKKYSVNVINDRFYMSNTDLFKNLDDIIGANISFYKNLKHIHSSVQGNGIKTLQHLNDVEILCLSNLDQSDIYYISLLTKLHTLNINWKYGIKDDFLNLELLKHLPIKNLALHDMSLNENHFAYFPDLEVLSICWCNFKSLSFLKKLPRLRKLFINTMPVNKIQHIDDCISLKELGLLNSKNIEDFTPLIKLTSLNVLDLFRTPIDRWTLNKIRIANKGNIKIENLEIKKIFGIF